MKTFQYMAKSGELLGSDSPISKLGNINDVVKYRPPVTRLQDTIIVSNQFISRDLTLQEAQKLVEAINDIAQQIIKDTQHAN